MHGSQELKMVHSKLFCKVCVRNLQPRKATLKAHGNSNEHQQRVSAVSSTKANVFQTSGLRKQQ